MRAAAADRNLAAQDDDEDAPATLLKYRRVAIEMLMFV